MGQSPGIQLWFDFGSNYCYPAVMRVGALARAAGVHVHWRPFLLGPVFKAIGWNTPPLFAHPAKAGYVWRDMERRCRRHGLPFRQPDVFPRRALLPMRLATIAASEPWMEAFCQRTMLALFTHDRDIDRDEVMHEVLDGLRLPARSLLAAANAPAARSALRALTGQALDRGIFGAPTMFAGTEMFWGDDRLEDAISWAISGGSDADPS